MDNEEAVRSLGRIEGKLDMLIGRFDKIEDRTSAIEKKQWYHSGGIAVAVLFLVPKMKAMMGL